MKLSIIIPVYNSSKYLNRCLDSLFSQDFTDFEVIVVNDGSRDNSARIIASYALRHDNIQFVNMKNGGQGKARNTGMRLAAGEYIGFVDSDDWIEPSMFSKLIGACEESGADMACCDYWIVGGDGSRTYGKGRIKDTDISCADHVWNKVFRRKLLEGIRFVEGGTWFEDFPFAVAAVLRSGKTVFVEEPLYDYSVGHFSTTSNSNTRKNLDMIRVCDIISEDCPKEEFDYLLINHVLLEHIKRINLSGGKGKRKVVKRVRKYVKKQIPKLKTNKSYLAETKNRRIIMNLNYRGLDRLSMLILKVKK